MSRPRKSVEPKRKRVKIEYQRAKVLADYMMNAGLTFIPFPNRPANVIHAMTLKRIGNQKGWPDFFVFNRPNIAVTHTVTHGRRTFTDKSNAAGVALELKRGDDEKPRPDQLERMRELRALGWLAEWGTDEDLIPFLREVYRL